MFKSLLVLVACLGLSSTPALAEIVRFSKVTDGIYRGGQPQTLEDYEYLASIGVKSLLNLREDGSVETEREISDQMGFTFLNVPMNGFKYPAKHKIKRALDFLTNPSVQPIFVHCRHGKDRTGMIVGLYRVKYEDWSARQAYREMQDWGFNAWLMGLTTYYWLHAH